MGNISVSQFYDRYLKTADKAGMMANEWNVQISAVGIGSIANQTLLDFYVNDITLPNKELIEVEKNYRGRKFQAPAGFKYSGDLEMTIDMDTDMTIYKAFAGMINSISPLVQISAGSAWVGQESALASAGLDVSDQNSGNLVWAPEWSPSATATVFIRIGAPIWDGVNGTEATGYGGIYVIMGAFPTVIGSVEFENASPSIATYKVTMAYAYFKYFAAQPSGTTINF